MKRFRVAEIVEATAGGTRRHVTDVVCHLDPARFDVTVLGATLRDPGYADDIRMMREHGAEFFSVNMVRNISPLRDLAAFVRIRRLLRGGRFDLVHAHSSKAGFLGRLAARSLGMRAVVYTPHTFPFQMGVGPVHRALYRLLERAAAGFTDRYVCVCRQEAEAGLAAGLPMAGKYEVIENGLPASAFARTGDRAAARIALGLKPEDVAVGTVGRFEPQKGLPDLVEAAATVIPRNPRARFVIVGEGTLMPGIENLIDRFGLGDRFILPGALVDAASVYAALDIFVLPSRWESLPYALLEAMAAGNAIVATRVGGVPDAIVDGVTGRLVPPADPAALAEVVHGLIQSPGLRQSLGGAARERALQRYRLETMMAKLENLYATLLTEPAIDGIDRR